MSPCPFPATITITPRAPRKTWNMKATVITFVIVALETAPKGLEMGHEELEIGG